MSGRRLNKSERSMLTKSRKFVKRLSEEQGEPVAAKVQREYRLSSR